RFCFAVLVSCYRGARVFRFFPTRRSSDLGGVGAVGFAVVDGDPERGAAAQFEVVDLLAEVEADPVGQKAHLHPRLTAVELIALTDRKSTRLNSSHVKISYAVFCLKKKIII